MKVQFQIKGNTGNRKPIQAATAIYFEFPDATKMVLTSG